MNRLTFAAWVKRDVITKRQFMIKCARHGGWGVYFSEEIDIPGNFTDYLWFTHHGAGGWHSDAKIADTQWHFVAVTLDQHVLNFYIDGKPSGRDSMPYAIDSGGGGYFLGGTPNDRDCSLQGCLAETLVFNRPLRPAEIAELYNQTRGAERVGKMAGLVAGYRLDEGRGTTVRDFSGHGNDGTLHGGVTWGRAGTTYPWSAADHHGGPWEVEIANSVDDFSGTQGLNNWYYGYYSGKLKPSTFKQFPMYDPDYAKHQVAAVRCLEEQAAGVLSGESAAIGRHVDERRPPQ